MMLTGRPRVLCAYDDHPIGDDVFKKVVVTSHEDDAGRRFTACTAVHRQDFERRIGGARFVEEDYQENFGEVAHLASAMTWKTALCGLPVDGEKTVVYCYGSKPETTAEKAEILAAHLHVLREEDPGVIFGPDMYCDETVMDALAHDHDLGEHVAGLSEGRGGFSIDEHGFTARGLDAAMVTAAELEGWDLSTMTASVEGFGAVGAHTARLLSERGVRVVAASIFQASLHADEGLPVGRLFDGWKRDRDAAFTSVHRSPPEGVMARGQDLVFEVPADIFVPAARTDCLMMKDELHDQAKDVEEFLRRTGVSAVLEGSNHPVSKRAEAYLLSRGVVVLPDYLINGGGLIGCWIDWCHRSELLRSGEEERSRLRSKAIDFIYAITQSNVRQAMSHTEDGPVDLRHGADELARKSKAIMLEEFEQRGGSVAEQRRRSADYLEKRLASSVDRVG